MKTKVSCCFQLYWEKHHRVESCQEEPMAAVIQCKNRRRKKMDKQTIAVIKQLFHFIEGICIFLRGYTVFIFSFGDILLNKLA